MSKKQMKYYIKFTPDRRIWSDNKSSSRRHREYGPAYEAFNGTKAWWYKDMLHRLDGPAVIYSSRSCRYFIEGKEYTQEEYEILNKVTTKL